MNKRLQGSVKITSSLWFGSLLASFNHTKIIWNCLCAPQDTATGHPRNQGDPKIRLLLAWRRAAITLIIMVFQLFQGVMPLRQIQTFNVPCISMTKQSWRRLHSYQWLWDHFRRKLVCVPPLSPGRNVVFAPSERFLLVRGLALMKENFWSRKSCL